MEGETMRSITAWLLLASAHQEPVPSHVTAAGSCAQVTRPGTMPRGTPSRRKLGFQQGGMEAGSLLQQIRRIAGASFPSCPTPLGKNPVLTRSFSLKGSRWFSRLETAQSSASDIMKCKARRPRPAWQILPAGPRYRTGATAGFRARLFECEVIGEWEVLQEADSAAR